MSFSKKCNEINDLRGARQCIGGGNETHSHLARSRSPSRATQVKFETKKGAKLSRPSTQGKKYLTSELFLDIIYSMSKELTVISPEGLEVANSYLQFGNIKAVCESLQVTENTVVETLNKREVKKYIDTVYLDLGYRNRQNIATVMDEMIQSKLDEAQESGMYSSKDLADLLQQAHKMRMDEIKAQADLEKINQTNIKSQTNVQINEGIPFGQGNYGKLMEKLLNGTE